MPKLTFKNPQGQYSTVPLTVDAKKGLSILEIAEECGARVGHACGGNLACSTCHVYVSSGGKSCGEASEEEEDMIDGAPAVRLSSRLACQAVPDGSSDVVVEIPAWNRNAVKEGH